MLTSSDLRSRLHYNPDTGVFTWQVPPKSRPGAAGRVAGSRDLNRYVNISIDRKLYKAHRLAWLYVYGEWPPGLIDHINGVRSDNRLCNLRVVDRTGNAENRRAARSGSASGFLGVVWRPRNRKYEARILANKKYMYLGLFATPEEAHAAYVAAKRKYHRSNVL